MSHLLHADAAGVEAAVVALRAGRLIGLPTETVYGLAGNLHNDQAMLRIFSVKGRPVDHPLIVHIADAEHLHQLSDHVSPACQALVDNCWPGPLTVIVTANAGVSRIATGGRDTVAVRMPAHPVARRVIELLGAPVAAPSANRFGRVSPTTAQHVAIDLHEYLGKDVALVLDGGSCEIGVESTIVDCTLTAPQILRPGAITQDDVQRLLGLVRVTLDHTVTGPSRASGMLERHYAPTARLLLEEPMDQDEQRVSSDSDVNRESLPTIDCSQNPLQSAHDLYSLLRANDEAGHSVVRVILPRAQGIGFALRDRLHKAAASK